MDKYDVTLGVYLHYKDKKIVWLRDVDLVDSQRVLQLSLIEHFLPGFHSFKAENISDEPFHESFESFFSFVHHKNKEVEKWTFMGRVVPQGMFYQII